MSNQDGPTKSRNGRTRRPAKALAALALSVVPAAGLAQAAGAATAPADKPYVTIGAPSIRSGGGVSPDTWYTTVTLPVGGGRFTAGGDVFVEVQDSTAGTAPVGGHWIKAGSGVCGLECNNYGRISTSVSITEDYHQPCGHWMTVWAWDAVKSPQAGYGWSYAQVQVSCS